VDGVLNECMKGKGHRGAQGGEEDEEEERKEETGRYKDILASRTRREQLSQIHVPTF
jgi:hypothetical protein